MLPEYKSAGRGLSRKIAEISIAFRISIVLLLPRLSMNKACLFLIASALVFGPIAGSAQRIFVNYATYGARAGSMNVTRTVQWYADRGRGFTVSNETFGADPAPGVKKTFRIGYVFDGRQYEEARKEGNYFDWPWRPRWRRD
jgi:hypothetical protein